MKSGSKKLYAHFQKLKKTGRCGWLILVDPDKAGPEQLRRIGNASCTSFLVGGSLLENGKIEHTIQGLRKYSKKPVFIFPGHSIQVHSSADGILLPSLISGRNADYLIGQHVHAAPAIARSGMEVISCGYLLCGNAGISGTQYITQTLPIPKEQAGIACATAMAGVQLGMQSIYLEGGSGSGETADPAFVKKICHSVEVPVIVGGGIRTTGQAARLKKAGATLLVTGNILEEDPGMIREFEKFFR